MTELTEEIAIINEGAEGGKSLFIEGIFMQANQVNRNGRSYPLAILEREVNRYNRDYIQKNRAFGELGHPQGPTVNPDRISHMIKSLKREGNDFIGKAKISNTPHGNIVKNLIADGAVFGVSSRGMGSLKEVQGINEVQSDFYLATAADIVTDPSAPDAFVQGIFEGKEWCWDGGILREKFVEATKRRINTLVDEKTLQEHKVQLFQDFLANL